MKLRWFGHGATGSITESKMGVNNDLQQYHPAGNLLSTSHPCAEAKDVKTTKKKNRIERLINKNTET